MNLHQVPTVVLPHFAPEGTEVEVIADAVEHVSLTFPVDKIQEKVVQVYTTNPAGLAAPLQLWIELAPFDTAAAYVQLAGPTILVATGDTILQWTTHSSFVRVVAQCPAWAAGAWAIQVVFEGKGT